MSIVFSCWISFLVCHFCLFLFNFCISFWGEFFYCCTKGALWHLQGFLEYNLVVFTPSIILLYTPSPHSWNSFSKSHFSIFIHEYIMFPPYSPSYILSLYSPPLSDTTLQQDLFLIFKKYIIIISLDGYQIIVTNVHGNQRITLNKGKYFVFPLLFFF
jgi:hypothetical protein